MTHDRPERPAGGPPGRGEERTRSETLGDPLHGGSVAAFVGHRVDDPDRESPRFPPGMEGAVRVALRTRLRDLDVAVGFASAARGGDILFLEELLGRGGAARVTLPFPAEAFETVSVGDWAPRFRRILSDPRVRVRILSRHVPRGPEQPRAFAACNRAIREEAVAFARRFGRVPTLVALWDGRPGDGPGGTADTVEEWTRADLPVTVVTPPDVRKERRAREDRGAPGRPADPGVDGGDVEGDP